MNAPLPPSGVSPETPEGGPDCGSYSLRKAIDAKCKECIYDKRAPGRWREQVAACESSLCPLHTVRPKSLAGGFAHE